MQLYRSIVAWLIDSFLQMPHADASLVPDSIKTKAEFWTHVHDQLEILVGGQRHWVSFDAILNARTIKSFHLHTGLEFVQCRFAYLQLLASFSQQFRGWGAFGQLVW